MTLPCVVDAYGLRVLCDHLHVLDGARSEVILTPHLGEFASLSKISANEILKDKVNIAKEFAKEHGVTLVLKGPNTLVVSYDGRMYVNQTGHQNLAKAGSGDVLAGLIGGFCAQNLDPFTASCMAVWLHGKAADISLVADPVFSALDLLDGINEIYKNIR
ncbi:MAG: NAD(P)H-hydrate dehydratase [Erysipelotrichaceae bacterium]|nr:NAD(P)H-hydrate dehydratase [Erysipelotrichaceae bacterium]